MPRAPRTADASAQRAELLSAMERAPLLGALSSAHRLRLTREARLVTLGARQVLWRKGERADHLGLVLVGRLALSRADGRRDTLLDVVGPGELLGEVAFTLEACYQSDAVCLRRARVALVSARLMHDLLEAEPRATTELALRLAEQVVRLMRQLETLSASSVDQRLARTLLALAERGGQPFPGGVLLPMRLRRADLAALAATTLETVSRKLGVWRRRGWVQPQPAGYLLQDLPALRALAGES